MVKNSDTLSDTDSDQVKWFYYNLVVERPNAVERVG